MTKSKSIENKFEEIDKLMEKNSRLNKFILDNAKIEPIHEKYMWSSNGIYIDIAVPGSGKSYLKMKMLMQQENLSELPYYELAVYCSTSNGFDETVLTHKDSIKKTKLVFVKDTELLDWLNRYLRRMLKYNSIMKYLMSNNKEITEEMERVFVKHGLKPNSQKPKDKGNILRFISKKLINYNWSTYPHRCFLVLDDFASHPLVRSKESEMSRLLKKLRHFNITVAIIVQTAVSIPREIKRMATDLVLFKGINEEDFKELFKVIPSTWNAKKIWEKYRTFKNQKDKLILHLSAGKIVFEFYKGRTEIYDDL